MYMLWLYGISKTVVCADVCMCVCVCECSCDLATVLCGQWLGAQHPHDTHFKGRVGWGSRVARVWPRRALHHILSP
jgi:hypothetical protein